MGNPKKQKITPIGPSPEEKRQIVDEFGRLGKQLDEAAPLEKRYNQLRDQILSWHANSPADQSFTEEGELYMAEISARAIERTIVSMPKLQKRLGLKTFLEICSVTLTKLKGHLGELELARFLKIEHSGSRRVKPIPKFPDTPMGKVA